VTDTTGADLPPAMGSPPTGISPALYSAAIALSPATGTAARTSWGILGILVVLLVGLGLLLPVKPVRTEVAATVPADVQAV
jgi:hypothetical protein